jgi:hypothetical protein
VAKRAALACRRFPPASFRIGISKPGPKLGDPVPSTEIIILRRDATARIIFTDLRCIPRRWKAKLNGCHGLKALPVRCRKSSCGSLRQRGRGGSVGIQPKGQFRCFGPIGGDNRKTPLRPRPDSADSRRQRGNPAGLEREAAASSCGDFGREAGFGPYLSRVARRILG